ncbi:MAG: cytosolic protein [Planctomycetaceae bacterium]
MIDSDSPWKEAIEFYLEDFLLLLFPEVHAAVDWSCGYEFLDKELQQIVRDSELGRRYVDKLVKVWLKSGEEKWILIHIEVQGDEEAQFGHRMFVYYIRLFDNYNRPVVSLAVLADENPNWRPATYQTALFGCQVRFDFPTAKLLDFNERWSDLEQSQNRIAVVVMAHLKAKETTRDPNSRLRWKTQLVRFLFERGWTRQDILELFRLIDWLMVLPDELKRTFDADLVAFEKEKQMPYITDFERCAIERGQAKGLAQAHLEGLRDTIQAVLEVRFGGIEPLTLEELKSLTDLAALQAARAAVQTVDSVESLRAIWRQATPS